MEHDRSPLHAEEGDQVVGKAGLSSIEAGKHNKKDHHRSKILQDSKRRKAGPDSHSEMGQHAEAFRLKPQRDRQQDDDDRVVAVQKNLERRIACQKLLAINVVECAPSHADKNKQVAQEVSSAGEV